MATTTSLNFPSTLSKCFLIGSFSRQPQPQIVRSETDGGLAKVRRRFTRPVINIAGALIYNKADLLTFNTFFEVACAAGALPFNFEDPVDGVGVFRFVNPPGVTAITDTYFQVTLELERIP